MSRKCQVCTYLLIQQCVLEAKNRKNKTSLDYRRLKRNYIIKVGEVPYELFLLFRRYLKISPISITFLYNDSKIIRIYIIELIIFVYSVYRRNFYLFINFEWSDECIDFTMLCG
ncbi:KRAB-A domain-containing protein 2-like [Aphis craccivora]|uniref:KRAB-A domain-containing protein 2-like n=1 Tax=Aphis craccivora TaxID=307492 RepID=A0A6G0Z1C8_APHCR|nr:KRAB-A domain-containing protein 2-like [Aphis craccivora]